MVFLDLNEDGFYSTSSSDNSDVYEPSVITDTKGNFHFNNLVMGQTYVLDVVIPPGFKIADGESEQVTFVYDGNPVVINFNLTLE